MPQSQMIPRDRGDDPMVYEGPKDLDGSDDDFPDNLNIVLTEN